VSIFAPQNVMGPAHRGNVIAQLAQTAAQNVMRRQKMKSLIQSTASRAGAGGANQPFRGSTMGHSTGVRGAVMRPGGAGAAPGMAGLLQGMQGAPTGGGFANYPDPGPADMPSLPSQDPTQAPGETAPGPVSAAPQPAAPQPDTTPQQAQAIYSGGGAVYSGMLPNGTTTNDNMNAIPLGNGLFYDPMTDSVMHSPGSASGTFRTGGTQL
jgi:hypothetical protein